MVETSPWIWLSAPIASLACAVLVHELGHALGATAGGRRVQRLVFGVGRPTWVLRRRRPALLVRPLLPLGGACVTDDGRSRAARWPIALELAAGALANAAIGALLWWATARTSSAWCGWLAWGQLVVAIAQLLPLRFGRGEHRLVTDGWRLLEVLRAGPGGARDSVGVSAST
ncbi:MAG: M50 family metallopeptidase [Deltaproteobacteria bacterium]|nr:M50 family metallopeptidase [Deltaproteobacteria bacterium]